VLLSAAVVLSAVVVPLAGALGEAVGFPGTAV